MAKKIYFIVVTFIINSFGNSRRIANSEELFEDPMLVRLKLCELTMENKVIKEETKYLIKEKNSLYKIMAESREKENRIKEETSKFKSSFIFKDNQIVLNKKFEEFMKDPLLVNLKLSQMKSARNKMQEERKDLIEEHRLLDKRIANNRKKEKYLEQEINKLQTAMELFNTNKKYLLYYF